MKATIFAALALAAAAAISEALAPNPNQVHAQGCVERGAETHCLVVKDIKSGILYNLLIKGEQPQPGNGNRFHRRASRGPHLLYARHRPGRDRLDAQQFPQVRAGQDAQALRSTGKRAGCAINARRGAHAGSSSTLRRALQPSLQRPFGLLRAAARRSRA